MTVSIDTLRDYLWYQFGIVPESIRLDTHFRDDLHLTDSDVKALIIHVSNTMGSQFSVDSVQQLTDVFDLMAYVLLRSLEESKLTHYADEPVWPIGNLPTLPFN